MVRSIISILIHLAANAVGLIVADVALDDLSVSLSAFLFALALFTVVEVVVGPILAKVARSKVEALQGGVALVTTAVGLIVTTLVVDGFDITGLDTWIAAVVIVWVAALVATLLLPVILIKRGIETRRKPAARR